MRPISNSACCVVDVVHYQLPVRLSLQDVVDLTGCLHAVVDGAAVTGISQSLPRPVVQYSVGPRILRRRSWLRRGQGLSRSVGKVHVGAKSIMGRTTVTMSCAVACPTSSSTCPPPSASDVAAATDTKSSQENQRRDDGDYKIRVSLGVILIGIVWIHFRTRPAGSCGAPSHAR